MHLGKITGSRWVMAKFVFRIFLFSCLSILICSCGPNGETIDTVQEDGVEVILNHLEPYRTGGAGSFRLDMLFEIDSENEEILKLGISGIFGFEVSSRGELFLLREYEGEGDFIFKFDRSGEFLKSFGPQGQGPGEFQNPHHIALNKKNNILILEPGRAGLRKYDEDGLFIDSFQMPAGDTVVTSGPGANLLVNGSSFSGRDQGKAIYAFDLKLLNPDLEVIKILDDLSFEFSPEKVRATEPVFCWSASRDSIFVANEDRGYEIRVFDRDGALIRKIRKEYQKVPLSDADRQRALRSFPESMRESMKKVLVFPEFFPPIQGLTAGKDGTLLVQTFEPGDGPGEFLFDIFNRDSVFIGRKSLNIRTWENHLWARLEGDRFYALEEKESGYRALRVYRMTWE
jgi:6-bladed beta-propeller protein